MPSLRQNWFEGWRLFAVLTLVLIALSIWIAGMRQFEADGVRMVIRFTARTSLLFFCLAFSAAALARLWPNAWTRWQRRNRRYLGITFAASHAIHAVAIVCFAMMDPAGYAAATSAASYVFGGGGGRIAGGIHHCKADNRNGVDGVRRGEGDAEVAPVAALPSRPRVRP